MLRGVTDLNMSFWETGGVTSRFPIMLLGKLVFAQFMEHLPQHTFRRCVRRYPSKYPTKTFSHLDQFLCMAFAQLMYRKSLRDIETCLCAHQIKLYHLGIRSHVAKSMLADANEQYDCI